MRQEALINELNELDHVVKAERAPLESVYIYTAGSHDRTVQKALFTHGYRILDISVNPSGEADCYIYAMAEDEATQYLEP